ncbi:hypothetical protein HOLleu_13299 [Holothuria leucospilota]|uniref:Uncharacterized protein n=1 Tax=Holothuria leucospilota TaxID=206669 RepID=A0A9Q1CCS1_HOLLE|nr:hypothetical protein HOLleu_13299 [Holothuria leucospilota]
MTFDLHQKQYGSSSQYGPSMYQVSELSNFPFLRYRVNKQSRHIRTHTHDITIA